MGVETMVVSALVSSALAAARGANTKQVLTAGAVGAAGGAVGGGLAGGAGGGTAGATAGQAGGELGTQAIVQQAAKEVGEKTLLSRLGDAALGVAKTPGVAEGVAAGAQGPGREKTTGMGPSPKSLRRKASARTRSRAEQEAAIARRASLGQTYGLGGAPTMLGG